MKRNRYFNISLCIHILCGILGIMILCFVPEEDHIRWNMGYIIGYSFFLSLLVMAFSIPKHLSKKVRISLRTYISVYLLGWIPAIFIPKGLFFLFVVLAELGGNATKIAENNDYIVRLYITASLFDNYNEKQIYRKQGIVEKYVGSFDAGDISPTNRYDIEDFQVDEKNQVFTGRGHALHKYEGEISSGDTVLYFPICMNKQRAE